MATDVVGRGIDVSSISHIFNYDIPQFCDDYVHRVGRTGRMGREGVAYTFVTPEEGNELTRIEMRIDRLLKRDEVPGFRPSAGRSASEPSDRRRSERRGRPASPPPEAPAGQEADVRPRRPPTASHSPSAVKSLAAASGRP